MKIRIDRISPEGLVLDEQISAASLDLAEGDVRLKDLLKVRAEVSRVSNQVLVDMELDGCLAMCCSRCLKEIEMPLHKQAEHDYPVDKTKLFLDLTPDIREDIILDFPIQPLCSPECKGLCPRCGTNRNEKNCTC